MALRIMEPVDRVRQAHIIAMALQHVNQLHLNMHLCILGLRMHRRRRPRRQRIVWQQPWIARRRQFGLYDQLLVELRREDQTSFRNFMRMPVEMYDEILQRIQFRISKQHTWLR